MRTPTRFNRSNQGNPYEDFNRMVDDFFNDSPRSLTQNFMPKAEIEEGDKAYLLSVDIPGMKEEDLKINFNQGILTVSGERKYEKETKKSENELRTEKYYGHFERSFRFTDDVDADQIEASYRDGVLEITLPKSPQRQARSIQIGRMNKTGAPNPEKH